MATHDDDRGQCDDCGALVPYGEMIDLKDGYQEDGQEYGIQVCRPCATRILADRAGDC